jgi:DNA transposition AAA+ family ATPase
MYTIAPLTNVALCAKAMEMITGVGDTDGLDRLVCLYGKTGTGKSVAATYTANKYDAYYVECRSVWTKKSLLEGICRAVEIAPQSTMARMVDEIARTLVASGKPLIIDEMDHVVERKAVDIIRDIYQASSAPILYIGEEKLPTKLAGWTQFFGRTKEWIQAVKGTPEDARVLAHFYCRRGVNIADDLLADMVNATGGLIRLMCTNIARIEEESLTMGTTEIDLPTWKKWNKGYLTGNVRVTN